MPPSPPENNPIVTGEGGSHGGLAGAGKSVAATVLPGVSIGELGLQYMDYTSRPVPQGPRSTLKRGLADSSSTSGSTPKRRHSSTPQTIGSMLLGEHVTDFVLFSFVLFFLFQVP